MRAHFLEDILERTGYKLTSSNQLDDYGQDKVWKTQRQLLPRKRKNQITTLVEVHFQYIYIYIERALSQHSSDIIIVLYRMPLKLLALRPMDRGHAILCQIGILIA